MAAYLVTGIKFETDQATFSVPIEIADYRPMVDMALRAMMFNHVSITYGMTHLMSQDNYSTSVPAITEYYVDINDDIFNEMTERPDDFVKCHAFAMYPHSCVVEIDLHDIDTSGSIEQLIFEQLIHVLPLTFCYRQNCIAAARY